MRFHSREQAAERLAQELVQYRERHPLVLGIPRGGVPLARIIADRLGADLDVVLVHKLRAPFQPELALGSIDEAGRVYLTPFAEAAEVSERAMDDEKGRQLLLLHERRRRYTAAHPQIPIAGRTVIIVDDGLATGSTAIAAVRSARAELAKHIVVAVAVAPPDTVAHLRAEADDVVCLHTPAAFGAVGAFFDDFSEVTDDDVVRLLRDRTAADRASTSASRRRASEP